MGINKIIHTWTEQNMIGLFAIMIRVIAEEKMKIYKLYIQF